MASCVNRCEIGHLVNEYLGLSGFSFLQFTNKVLHIKFPYPSWLGRLYFNLDLWKPEQEC